RAQDHLGCSHRRTSIPGRHKTGRLAFTDEANADVHGRLLLRADRLRGLVFHGDDFVSVDDFDGELREPAMAIEFRSDAVFLADQQHTRAELAGGLNRPLDLGSRGAVGTHGIQSYDAWHGVAVKRLAGFFHFHYFASFVVAALGAGAMRHLLL